MKLADLGVNSKTGHHDKTLTNAESCFVGLLWIDHMGEDNKIPADELAIEFYYALDDVSLSKQDVKDVLKTYREFHRRELDVLKRSVRWMHNHLLTQHEHTPILSRAGVGGGYWVADSKEEAERFYDTFRQRGLTGLVKAARGKQSVLVEMMTQLSFEFGDLVDKSETRDRRSVARSQRKRAGAPAAIAVVDAFLEKMLRNPEKYSEDLKKIGQKFGSILLPKTQVSAMQAKAAELQVILSGLTA